MIGQIAALALAVAAFGLAAWRARRPVGFYDGAVYAMSARVHRRYAVAFAVFAAAFAIELVLHVQTASLILYSAFALLVVFYATSFLRGFSDEDA